MTAVLKRIPHHLNMPVGIERSRRIEFPEAAVVERQEVQQQGLAVQVAVTRHRNHLRRGTEHGGSSE